MKKILACLLSCGVSVTAAAQSVSASPPLTIRVEGMTLSISGASSGGDVFLFASSIMAVQFSTVYEHPTGFIAAKSDGSASLALHRPLSTWSIWFAVDMETGRTAMFAPPGSPAHEVIPPGLLDKGPDNKIAKLRLPFELVDVALVRPGDGVWKVVAADGGHGDGDGKVNGSSSVTLEAFDETKAGKKAPKSLKKDDVLLVLDPRSLGYYVVTGKE